MVKVQKDSGGAGDKGLGLRRQGWAGKNELRLDTSTQDLAELGVREQRSEGIPDWILRPGLQQES